MTASRARRAALLALLLGFTGACRSFGAYTWVDDLPPEPPPAAEYLVQPGDLLAVRVLNQDAVSTRVRVRQDGQISLAVVGDVQAQGLSPQALAAEVKARLQTYYQAPSVVVSVEEASLLQISVLGEVVKPGAYGLAPKAGVLEALALAGGLTPFAARDWIVVLRRVPGQDAPLRIRFDYAALTRGQGKAPAFRFKGGDVLFAE